MSNGYRPGPPRGGAPQSFDATPSVSDEQVLKIVAEGDAELLNNVASQIGEYCVAKNQKDEQRVTTSQIRAILDQLQRMREFSWKDLQLLRPRLAYTAGRNLKSRFGYLRDVLERAIKVVEKDAARFENFRNFFEAIVAYHRYHGGK